MNMYIKLAVVLLGLCGISISQPTCQQSCSDSATCTLIGDPHLRSFYGRKQFIKVKDDEIINVYTLGDFVVDATTYHKDVMNRISFGNYVWHKLDCKNKTTILEKQNHIFPNGDSIEGIATCHKYKNKMHLNLKLIKYVSSTDGLSFEELEKKSTGVCTLKPRKGLL